MVRKFGVQAYGLIAPIIREGDCLSEIVTETVLNSGLKIDDRDIVAITESVVARAQGNYVTIDEVAEEIKKVLDNPKVVILYRPIYSRNRFAMILKAFARAVTEKVIIVMPEIDEVGNELRNHPFTGLNYDDYYKSIVEAEGKTCFIIKDGDGRQDLENLSYKFVDCRLHLADNFDNDCFTLKDFCKDKCEWGLLGSNKASEEKLKLFPSKKYAQELVEQVRRNIIGAKGKIVSVMVYGDGCFKDPVGGIWEFADPCVSPAYTKGLEGTPNELKLKNLADEKYAHLNGRELSEAIREQVKRKDNDLKGKMTSQGTTPRRIVDLVGSLADLMSGSGDKATPIVYIKGYFNNYATEEVKTDMTIEEKAKIYDKIKYLLSYDD